MSKRALIVLAPIAAVGAIALNIGPAAARQGADDPVGHVRHGHRADGKRAHAAHHRRGADDRRAHTAHHRHGADDRRAHTAHHRHGADDTRAHTAHQRHGADDRAGDDRRGRGTDD